MKLYFYWFMPCYSRINNSHFHDIVTTKKRRITVFTLDAKKKKKSSLKLIKDIKCPIRVFSLVTLYIVCFPNHRFLKLYMLTQKFWQVHIALYKPAFITERETTSNKIKRINPINIWYSRRVHAIYGEQNAATDTVWEDN